MLPNGERWYRRYQKRCISNARRAVCLFSLARQGGCKVFAAAGGIYTHRRQAIPQPSAAKPLSNLRTLGAKAPSILRTFFLSCVREPSPSDIYRLTFFPPTGIYRPMSHYLRVLRAFCRECASRPKLARRRGAKEHHYHSSPRTPFCHFVALPLKGKREI